MKKNCKKGIQGTIAATFCLVLLVSCAPKEVATTYHNITPAEQLDTLGKRAFVYALPLNSLEFTVEAVQTIQKPGPYHEYAGELLGLEEVISEAASRWEITSVHMKVSGEPDPDHYYVAETNETGRMNALEMGRYGLILKPDPGLPLHHSSVAGPETGTGSVEFPDRGGFIYTRIVRDTSFRTVRTDTAFIRIPYLQERTKGLTVKEQAVNAADNVLSLREGKMLLLTGDATVFPQDGAALQEINRMEEEYLALFAGKQYNRKRVYHFEVIPRKDMVDNPLVMFRFSRERGILPLTDMTGRPVAVELLPQNTAGELEDIVPQYDKGNLLYRIPEITRIRLTNGTAVYIDKRVPLYQLGTILPVPDHVLFRNKK